MIKNAVTATKEQFQTFKDGNTGDPIYMVNLLKFKDKAEYKDGSDAHLTGKEAYARYAKGFTELTSPHGVTSIFGGDVKCFMIGEGEGAWDSVAVVLYPSVEVMAAVTTTDEYKKIHKHRRAGLEGQLLIECDGSGVFGNE